MQSHDDIFVKFISHFKNALVHTILISGNAFHQEHSLIEYVKQRISFFEDPGNCNLNVLRETIFNINWLLTSIPHRPEGFFNYLVNGPTRGKIHQHFANALKECKNHPLYKAGTAGPELTDPNLRILSHWNFTSDQLLKAFTIPDSLSTLVFSCNSVNDSDPRMGIRPYFTTFIRYLPKLRHLKELNLTGNCIGYLEVDQIRQLADELKNFSNLETLNLSGNYINDLGLRELLTGIKEIASLKLLDLSNNFIELDPGDSTLDRNYSNSPSSVWRANDTRNRTGSISQSLKEMREKLRNLKIDISANYIAISDSMANQNFQVAKEVKIYSLHTEIRKVECIISPKHFIDPFKWLVTIAKRIGNEHAMILIERMDKKGQLYLMAYHVTSRNHADGKSKIEVLQCNPSRFFEDRKNYRFWDYFLIESSSVEEFESSLKTSKPPELAKFTCGSQEHTTCIKWALDGVKQMLGEKKASLYIPTFQLHNIASRILRRDYYLESDENEASSEVFDAKRWYTNDDIEKLLSHYRNGTTVKIFDPIIAYRREERRFIPNLPAKKLKSVIKGSWENLVNNHQIIVVPMDLGNSRWEILSIHLDDTKFIVNYCSPLSEGSLFTEIYLIIQEMKLDMGTLLKNKKLDECDCGPCIIEFVKLLIQQGSVRLEDIKNIKIDEVRKNHWKILSDNSSEDKREIQISGEEDEILEQQRSIKQIKIGNDIKECIVVPADPDGNCGFTAIRQFLTLQERPELAELAETFSREKFIELIASIANGPQQDEAYKIYINKIFQADGVVDLDDWKTKFKSSGYWMNEAHFRFVSYYFKIDFYFYYLPPEQNQNAFEPEPTNEAIKEKPSINNDNIKVSLAHVKTHSGGNLNHFDTIIVAPSDSQKQQIADFVQREREEARKKENQVFNESVVKTNSPVHSGKQPQDNRDNEKQEIQENQMVQK